ncbi:MAG: cell envelope protein SmpA [Gammaproteobacteria bacterium]|jgi:outer membrane protein assembly factor BamE (lipoprotein component of BamABCDE complex)|nr:cell envelope protein SmpA [Gammaproteobacteria bacterium]|tara:strand:- start:33 stop:464 length:432 start_codon:yes stop_codon:yes gene_type:complete
MHLKTFIVIFCCAGLISCTPQIDTRGHVPSPDLISKIKPGHQSRDQVITILGSPSAIGTFEDNRWYYITQKTESTAFFEPKLVKQSIILIDFDEGGFVKSVETLDPNEAKKISFVDRVTPTKGKSLGFFEQIFGNLGVPIGGQ